MMSLRTARLRAGKTIREVAQDNGVTERSYIRWEQGDVLPDAVNLVKLAKYFGITEEQIVSSRPTEARQ